MNKINNYILQLIACYFVGEITKPEASELAKWLEESPENKAHFLEYLQFYEKSKQISFADSLDKEQAWNSILTRLKTPFHTISIKKKEKIILFQKPWFKYVAVAVFAGIIFSTYFFNNNFNSSNTVAPKVSNTIIQGASKAKLTLDDGTEVLLKKGAEYTSNSTKSNGENIVYENDDIIKTDKIAYNYLTIPRGGQFLVQLSDGTKIWLNSASKLKYPVNFVEGKPRQIELIYGEVYLKVSSSELHKGATFKVLSKGQEIEVLGTEFNIKSYEDENISYSTLVEGKIALETGGKKLLLKPNEQAVVNQENGSVQIIQVDVRSEISWKEGVFSFKGKPLKEVMKVLSRWYDVEVVFETETLKSKTFKGVLDKNQKLEDILAILKSASSLKSYKIKDRKIILK